MRDPQRIDRLLEKIRFIWKNHQDLRLGELINNPGYPFFEDIYFMEDDELEKKLNEYYLGY